MQATGSDQDKPLGSRAVFSLQGGLSIQTLPSICLLHTSVHIPPSVSFLCLRFHFGFPFSSSPGWRLAQSDVVQKIQVWGFSGSDKPRVFVETIPCTPPPPAPPPSYTSVSHLHLGSKFSTRTEAGGGGPETSIPYAFLPRQMRTCHARFFYYYYYYYCRCPLLSVKNRPGTNESDCQNLTRTVKHFC